MENIILNEEESLEKRFERERLEWNEKIANISNKLKNVFDIPELMTTIYTERQRCVDYYHYLMDWVIKINKKYSSAYSERYDYYTTKSQIRYPTENAKHNRILTDLHEIVEKREILSNHAKFIDQCIKTIDSIIYGISKRVEIEQISRGK